MLKCIRDNVLCLPPELITFTLNHSIPLVAAAFFLTFLIAVYSVFNFSIDTDLNNMVSEDLPFRQDDKRLSKLFPQLSDTLDIVIDGQTPELAMSAQKMLARQLKKNNDLFKTVFVPGGGSFFEKNGLFYMSIEELEDLTTNLAEAQPFLAILSQDWSLSGFFASLKQIVKNSDESVYDNKSLILLYSHIVNAIESIMKNEPFYISWQEIMLGKEVEQDQLRRFIIVQPMLDYNALYPGEEAIDKVNKLINTLNLTQEHGVQVRITGSVALNYDDLISVESGIGTAALASLILIFVVLYMGLNSLRMVIISLITLIVGLIWTMGFAIAFIGSLNLLSITFAVLFIGLGIDYSIQFCMRYKELTREGINNREAISNTAQSVWNALYLCSITTAIGFYAFFPTDYVGASELGIISGTGMFISLLINVTVLPALLNLFPLKESNRKSFSLPATIISFPEKNAKAVVISAIILGIVAAALMPKVFFDFNPLNLSDPEAGSVKTAMELFNSSERPPWTISVIAPDYEKAQGLANSLSKLKEVDNTVFIGDLIPDNQDEKSSLIEDMSLFLPPLAPFKQPPSFDYAKAVKSLKEFEAALEIYLSKMPEQDNKYIFTLRELYATIKKFNALIDSSPESESFLRTLEKGILPNLASLLNRLDLLVMGEPFGVSDLPKELREQYESEDGHYRIQVFPRENIDNISALERFVASVRTIAPRASDAPVSMLESGRAIFRAFLYAIAYALVLIIIFLYMVLRKIGDVVLAIFPIIMSLLLTSAVAAVIGIPYNFANIIVIPLMLGIGVDYSIHILHRFRTEPDMKRGILGTSTARGVLFSALTTVVSFGSLSFMAHQGTASIGKLLTLSICFIILSTLIVLPAVLRLYQRAK
jgi:hopanoid biosynthesis associated RND transporter like protein HpnN